MQNVIKIGFDNILENEGLTLTVNSRFGYPTLAWVVRIRDVVSPSYEVTSSQRIALKFYSASLDDVQISPLVESLLAPAFLPRTGANHQLLLAIREVNDSSHRHRDKLRRSFLAVFFVRAADAWNHKWLSPDVFGRGHAHRSAARSRRHFHLQQGNGGREFSARTIDNIGPCTYNGTSRGLSIQRCVGSKMLYLNSFCVRCILCDTVHTFALLVQRSWIHHSSSLVCLEHPVVQIPYDRFSVDNIDDHLDLY